MENNSFFILFFNKQNKPKNKIHPDKYYEI